MSIIKKALIVLIILLAIPFIIALFAPNNYAVEREIIIDKPKSEVFEYIKYLKNQDDFSKWANLDPNMKKSYSGTDGTVGFISAWESKQDNVGVGEQEITGIVEGERIDYELRFKEPMEGTNYAYMTTEAIGETQTKVKWGFKADMPFPLNFMMVVFDFEEMIGTDFQTGLDNLKTNLDKK